MSIIYFATNRNPLNGGANPTGFGSSFATANLGDLRFGRAEVIKGKLEPGSIETLPDNPDQGSKVLLKELRKKMRKKSLDSLIFIHGFNVSFKGAIESAAKLSDRFSQLSGNTYQPNMFVFSWPSNGKLLDYGDDRHDAKASGYAFARGLAKLSEFLKESAGKKNCHQKINLIAHSMGNYVLRHTLQEAQAIHGDSLLQRLFDNIVLTAADEDNDAFEETHKLARLPELSKSITIYYNTEDRALDISDITKGNPERLGSSGPRKPHQISGKVITVDVSEVVNGVAEHSYHVESDRVVMDLIAVLKGEKPDSIPSRIYVPHANKFRLVNSN